MPVEVAKLVDDFNKLWPRGTDPVSKADDHIRMIKEVLQLEFELLYNKTRVFSFEAGAVVNPDCILYYEAEKAFYQWNGAYDVNNEYVVYAGSTPETAGGIGGNAWTRSTGSGFMSTVLVSDTEPTAPFQNMLWWDTNSGTFFIYYNDGTSTQWVDLFGIADQASFNTLLFRSILARLAAESGYTLVGGSFQEGAISSGFSDVVLDWNTAKFYQWHLNENKEVPAGSTPETAGGVGTGAWVDRSEVTLRGDINIIVRTFDSVSAMVNDSTLETGMTVCTLSYNSGWSATTYGAKGGLKYQIVASGTGIADGMQYIDLTGSGLQAKAIFDTVVEPEHAGCYGDGTHDDTTAFQAFVSAGRSNSKLRVGSTYLLTNTVTLHPSKGFYGDNPKGAVSTPKIHANHSGYAFKSPNNTFARGRIYGFTLKCINGFDLRSESRTYNFTYEIDHITYEGGDGTGIGVYMLNHDFSSVHDCQFNGWNGLCAIRQMGWYDTTTQANNKANTQSPVYNCSFNGSVKIGISADLVQSTTYGTSNDFSNTDYPFDLGGKVFHANRLGTSGNYKRGEADPTVIVWASNTPFTGMGWVGGGVKILFNHLEYALDFFNINCIADTSDATLIFGNDIYISSRSLKVYRMQRTINARILENNIDYATNVGITILEYASNINLNYGPDNITSKTLAVADITTPYVDAGGNFFTKLNRQGGKVYTSDQGGTRFASLQSDGIGQLNGVIASNSTKAAVNYTLGRGIRTSASLSNGATTTLIQASTVEGKMAGMLYLTVDVVGVGSTSTVWALGRQSATKISGETQTANFFTVNWDDVNKKYVLTSVYATQATFIISGFYDGLGSVNQ